jgi:hypothetical protein
MRSSACLQLLAAIWLGAAACGGDDPPPTTILPRIDAGEIDSGTPARRDSGQDPPPKDAGSLPADSGNPFPRDAGHDSGPATFPDSGGDVIFDPGPAPDDWTCATAIWNDGYCDCGCGVTDSDCVGQSCTELGCIAQGCEACYTDEHAWKPCAQPLDPTAWTCDVAEQNDLLCDCGCTVPDDACRGSGCSEPSCWRGACDIRHGTDGSAISPSRPPLGWTCPSAAWGGGNGCDCGCGTTDPDCQSAFTCTSPLCNDTECSICHDGTGRTVPCSGSLSSWKCDAQRFGSGDGCDCGCGVADPDCGDQGCSAYGCRADSCERCTDTGVPEDRLVGCGPAQWTCDLGHYGTKDGCDCGCGIADPDCGSGNGCTDVSCQNDKCDYCHTGGGETDYQICNGWTCGTAEDLAWKEDKCDCGCGKPDPRCRAVDRIGCTESGCTTATCEFCNSTGAARAECDGPKWSTEGTCARRIYGLDGKCDCGCGAIDPDCGEDEGCSDPYCAAKGCEVCHGSGTQLATCYTWTCAAEAYGDGKCDCGCGAPDPDCSGFGCTEPGCRGQTDVCKPDGCHDPFGRQVVCP